MAERIAPPPLPAEMCARRLSPTGCTWQVFKLHRRAPGFKIYATDFPPALPAGGVKLNREILAARYCLSPSGTGWGMRVFHVLALGCVPVVVQHDGEHAPVRQAFEPLLNWSDFGVTVSRDQVADLPALLAATDLAAKRRALVRVWRSLVWRDALAEPLRSALGAPDAFEMTLRGLDQLLQAHGRGYARAGPGVGGAPRAR